MGRKGLNKNSLINFDDFKDVVTDDVDCSLGVFSHSSKCEELYLNVFSVDDLFNIFTQIGLVGRLLKIGFDNDKVNYLKVDFDKLENYFSSKFYKDGVKRKTGQVKYILDYKSMMQKRDDLLKTKDICDL